MHGAWFERRIFTEIKRFGYGKIVLLVKLSIIVLKTMKKGNGFILTKGLEYPHGI